MNPTHNKQVGKTALQTGWSEFSHLLFAVLFGCLAIALVALASWLLGEPPAVFTREPQQVLGGSAYVGSFSNLGGMVWFGAAAILSFAGSLKLSDRRILILAAVLTWAMGVDDIFMLHDRLYTKLYLNEGIVSAFYFGTIGVKNQLKLAEECKAPLALIMGQKEAMDEMVILRDVKSGMQEVFSYDKIIVEVKKRLER